MPDRPPNVVLIVADDLGYGDISCYGNPHLDTPALDRLAAEGTTLTDHYSASPKCAPARAGLLTGRYNHRTGATSVESNRGNDRIALDEVLVSDALRSAGYATGMVGKWHNGLHDNRHHPNARGFEEFVGFRNGGMDYWNWVLDYNGARRTADGRYLTDVFTDEAVEFVRRHQSEPFFLYLAYNAPHNPLQAPDDLVEKYRSIADLSDSVAILYAMIERMDTGIGRLMETIDELGLGEDTLFVFTSDNGPNGQGENGELVRYNGPFSGQKGDALEGGIRVPAIARWPAEIPAGVESDPVVHFADWFPTFLAAAGSDVPPALDLDGRDVMPLLRGEGEGEGRRDQERWFWQHNRYEPVRYSNAAVRDGNWKLYWPARVGGKHPDDTPPYQQGLTEGHWFMEIDTTLPGHDPSPPSEPRLYDLKADPGESENLAGEHPERVAELRAAWEEWFDDVVEEWRDARETLATNPIWTTFDEGSYPDWTDFE